MGTLGVYKDIRGWENVENINTEGLYEEDIIDIINTNTNFGNITIIYDIAVVSQEKIDQIFKYL